MSGIAVVSGGSSGIGRSIVEQLCAHGWEVWALSRRGTGPGAGEHCLECDVRDEGLVREAVATILAQSGRIDLVVAAAGNGIAGPLEECEDADLKAQLATNLFGVHHLIRAALPAMRERGQGKLILIGSLAGKITLPFQGAYCLSKHALEAYAESLRYELRPFGLQVCIVQPGDFHTGFTDARRYVKASEHASSPYRAALRASLDRTEADERGGRPATVVAKLVVKLARARRLPAHAPIADPLQMLGLWARRWLPYRWLEAVIARMYGE